MADDTMNVADRCATTVTIRLYTGRQPKKRFAGSKRNSELMVIDLITQESL
jgi:hypothetical protein